MNKDHGRVPRSMSAEYEKFVAQRDRSSMQLQSQILTWRGFCVGSVLSFFLATSAPYGNMIMRGTHMAIDFDTPGAIFLFLFLIGVLNTVLKLAGRNMGTSVAMAVVTVSAWITWQWRADTVDLYSPGLIFSSLMVLTSVANLVAMSQGRSLALNRAELILVYAMMLIVSSLCTMGLSEQLPGFVTAIFYYASPENQWAEKLFPHFPDKHILVNDGNRNTLFYEGLDGGKIPYGAWIEPLLWWAVFLVALYMTMVSIAVILRRQWMEYERLAYPVAQAGLALIRGEGQDHLVNRFFTRPSMWMGWAIPMIGGVFGGLQSYGIFSSTPLSWSVSLFGGQTLTMTINFIALGFSYLIHTHLAIGICLFHVLAKMEKALFQITGITSEYSIIYGVAGFPLLGYQGAGALFGMVFVGLWVARSHLKDVALKAIGKAPHVDDGDEIMSYRSAVLGVGVGVSIMVWWLWLMGTPAWISLLFVVVALLVFIGITRIVIEAGIVALRAPMCAPDLIIQGVGSTMIGPTGVFNLSLAYMWAADVRVFVMGTCALALKLIEDMDRRSRRLVFWGIVLALLIGALGSLWMIFHLTYKYGGVNMNVWFFKGGPAVAYDNAVRHLEPRGVYWPGIGFLFGGGVVMALMMVARTRLAWWPIHPIGVPIGANAMTDSIWFSVFLAWMVKVCVLRFGGAGAYRRSVPFFLGILTGKVTSMGLWLVVDYFSGKVG